MKNILLLLYLLFPLHIYAGGVVNGQPVNASITNAAFLFKNADDTDTHVLSLHNGNSSFITDPQKALNTLFTASGSTENVPGTAYNAPAGTVTNGDTYEFAIGELAAKVVPASTLTAGIVTTSSQSFSGDKTFANNVNVSGTLTLANPLTVMNGGTGTTIFGINSVVLGEGSGSFNSVTGSQYQSLIANGSGDPSFQALALNQSAAVTGTLAVGNGGTGIGSGTSGGIPYFNTTSSMASSALLGSGSLVLGGGAGNAPFVLGAGSTDNILKQGSSSLQWGSINLGSSNAVGTSTLTVANGGTGQTSLNAHAVLLGNGTGTINFAIPSSTSGFVLTSNGTGSDPTWQSPSGTGTVTDVGLTMPSGFIVSGSPITTAGTFVVTGTLAVGSGGTGQSTLTNHGVLVGAGSSAITQLSAASAGTVLTGQGASSDPSFSATPTLGVNGTTPGTLSIANGNGGGASVTLANPGTTSAYTINLPTSIGSNGQILTSSGASGTLTWTSPVSGAKNYLSVYNGNTGNGNFEFGNTTGWSLGTVGTLTNNLPTGTPTFGSGASGNLSISAVTSGAIAGTYSLSYASSSATTQGNMVASSAFTIDTEDQAKVLTVKFYYSPTVNPSNGNFSATSSNSFAWAAWDVTNSAWLSSAGNFCINQSSGVGYCTGTFQTASTTASIRFVVYNANASSGAITMLFDDIFIGPQTAPIGPAVGDWISFTPTGSWNTNTTYTGYYRRVGDSADISIRASLSGAPNNTSLTINMPTGLTIDTTKMAGGSAQPIAGVGYVVAASNTYVGVLLGNNATSVLVRYAQTLTGANPVGVVTNNLNATTPATFASGDAVTFNFKVPIVGWSSNSVQSSDTDTRVVAARAQNATATITSSLSDVTWTTVTDDTAGSFSATSNTIPYIIPVTGYYDFSSQLQITATPTANNTTDIAILKNGSVIAEYQYNYGSSSQTGGVSIPLSAQSVKCNAGDTIKVQVSSTAATPAVVSNTSFNFFQIKRVSGPAVITATESVNGRYHASTSSLTSSFTTTTFSIKDFDSHSAYASGTLIIPVSGKYQLNAGLQVSATTTAAGNSNAIAIFINGSQYDQSNVLDQAVINGDGMEIQISDIIQVNTGDSVTVRSLSTATGPAITSSNVDNFFSWARVGN